MSSLQRAAHGFPIILSAPRGDGFTRKGLVVVRSFLGDAFTERDYQEITWGGRTQPLAPISAAQRAWAQQRLDNLCLDSVTFHNVACNAGRTSILNYIGNIGANPGANVFAVGTGNVTSPAPASTDTQLVNEVFRLGTSSTTVSGNSVQINTFFSTSQGNYTYTEAGLFSVASPPGSANTGTMYAHTAYSYTKTSSISLTNDYFIYLN